MFVAELSGTFSNHAIMKMKIWTLKSFHMAEAHNYDTTRLGVGLTTSTKCYEIMKLFACHLTELNVSKSSAKNHENFWIYMAIFLAKYVS